MFKLYLPLYEQEKINYYTEFNIPVKIKESVPREPGIPMNHQKVISNLMRGVTNIESLLLVHDMGTGKTCTSIQAIEKNLKDNIYGMKRGLILNRGKAIQNNFIYELVNKCTTEYKTGNSKTEKSMWSKFYTFDTFEIFSKKIQKMTNETIAQKYNNTFIVIDEVHNILNDESTVYNEISRFLNAIPNKRVLLLTGTPVRDSPEDFVPIINLILEDKINKNTFRTEYYDNFGNLTEKFKQKLMGKVSFLKASQPDVDVIYEGYQILDLKKFKVVSHLMSDFQNKIYIEAFNRDSMSGGIYTNSRQASRFVFPDGSYGSEGFNKYVINNKRFSRQMIQELDRFGIKKFSSKYSYIIDKILEADKKREKTIVYDDLVKGSGLIVFSLLLDYVGFKKYRLLTSETTTVSEITKIQNKFNSDPFGTEISVIIGSKVIAEGFTFLDVLHEHVVPHWNNTETSQVIARGIRMGSHQGVAPNSKVTIYRNVSLYKDQEKSIDYIMTKTSEQKEMEIDKILNVIKEVSVTCNSFLERNGGKCFERPPSYLINDNYFSVGFLDKTILNEILLFFSKNNVAHYNDIPGGVKYLQYIISSKIVIKNRNGINCYLYNDGDYYFLVDDINDYKDKSMSYYALDVKPYNDISMQQRYEDALEIELDNLDSPKNIQRLLELSVTIKMCNLRGDTSALDRYPNSWYINDNTGVVWYRSEFVEEKASPMCLVDPKSETPWNEWVKCPKTVVEIITKKKNKNKIEFETEIRNRKKKFYGQLNPDNNEFCIKEISDNSSETDKRKIASGKRCVNWPKNVLLSIAGSKEQNRQEICDEIFKTFQRENLILEDKSCGVSTKRK